LTDGVLKKKRHVAYNIDGETEPCYEPQA